MLMSMKIWVIYFLIRANKCQPNKNIWMEFEEIENGMSTIGSIKLKFATSYAYKFSNLFGGKPLTWLC